MRMTYRNVIRIFHFLLQSIRHWYANNSGDCAFICLKRAGRGKKKGTVFYAIEYSSIDIITSKISKILFTQQIKGTLVTRGTNALAVIPQISYMAFVDKRFKLLFLISLYLCDNLWLLRQNRNMLFQGLVQCF